MVELKLDIMALGGRLAWYMFNPAALLLDILFLLLETPDHDILSVQN